MSKLTPWFCFWVTRQSHSRFLYAVLQIYSRLPAWSNWHLKCKRSTQSASPCHKDCWTVGEAQHVHAAVGHRMFTSCSIFVTSDHIESKEGRSGLWTCYLLRYKNMHFVVLLSHNNTLPPSAVCWTMSPHILRIPGWSKLEIYLMHFTYISSHIFKKIKIYKINVKIFSYR